MWVIDLFITIKYRSGNSPPLPARYTRTVDILGIPFAISLPRRRSWACHTYVGRNAWQAQERLRGRLLCDRIQKICILQIDNKIQLAPRQEIFSDKEISLEYRITFSSEKVYVVDKRSVNLFQLWLLSQGECRNWELLHQYTDPQKDKINHCHN